VVSTETRNDIGVHRHDLTHQSYLLVLLGEEKLSVAELVHARRLSKEMETRLAVEGRISMQECHHGKQRPPASKCSPPEVIMCSRCKRASTREVRGLGVAPLPLPLSPSLPTRSSVSPSVGRASATPVALMVVRQRSDDTWWERGFCEHSEERVASCGHHKAPRCAGEHPERDGDITRLQVGKVGGERERESGEQRRPTAIGIVRTVSRRAWCTYGLRRSGGRLQARNGGA